MEGLNGRNIGFHCAFIFGLTLSLSLSRTRRFCVRAPLRVRKMPGAQVRHGKQFLTIDVLSGARTEWHRRETRTIL